MSFWPTCAKGCLTYSRIEKVLTSEVFGDGPAGLHSVLQVTELLFDSLHVDGVCRLQVLHMFTQFLHLSNTNCYIFVSCRSLLSCKTSQTWQ